MSHTLFISDLHLSADDPALDAAFLGFLVSTAPAAEALYILGDLFDYWAGDDDLDDPYLASAVAALRRVSDAGTALWVMSGNRDVLLGSEFARAIGGRLLPDPTLIDLYGTPTLLAHGDAQCTGDIEYQAFRAKVRTPEFQAEFLAQPLAARKTYIENLRRRSDREKRQKSETLMDVNPDAIAQLLREYGYPRLIHGHTHRPARHQHEVDGHSCERWVLCNWETHPGYLHCDATGCHPASIPLETPF